VKKKHGSTKGPGSLTLPLAQHGQPRHIFQTAIPVVGFRLEGFLRGQGLARKDKASVSEQFAPVTFLVAPAYSFTKRKLIHDILRKGSEEDAPLAAADFLERVRAEGNK
jgi:hypothetical protein